MEEKREDKPSGFKPEQLIWGIAFAFFSGTLLVVNKKSLTYAPADNALYAVQQVTTSLLVYLTFVYKQKTLRIQFVDGTPFSSRKTALWFSFCTLLQIFAISTNMRSLRYLGVDRVVLLRVTAMCPIALGEWLLNNRMLPSTNTWICFATLFEACVFVFGGDNADIDGWGIFWGLLYFVSISLDQVLLKTFTRTVKMNDSERTFWINLLGLPVSCIAAALVGEWPVITSYIDSASTTSMLVIGLSCILGAGISYVQWGLRSRVSGTTFSLVGVICKLGSIALNWVLLPHVGPTSILWITLGITSTWFYEQAPERVPTEKSERDPSEKSSVQVHQTPLSKVAVALMVVVFVGGTILHPKLVDSRSTATGPAILLSQNKTTVVQNFAEFTRFHANKTAVKTASWHRCVGRGSGASSWKWKSCHFKSVCYDGNTAGELTYFVDPLDQTTTPEDLSSGTMTIYVPNDPRSRVLEYKVRLSRQSLPMNATWAQRLVTTNTTKPVIVLANYFLPSVWTHLVFDNMLPTFRLLEIFGFDPITTDVEARWLSYPCDKDGWHDGCDFEDKRYNPKWINLMSLQPTFGFNKFQWVYANASSTNWTCFDDVLTGLSLYTDHGEGWSDHGRHLETPVWTNFGTGLSLWNFREWTLQRALLRLQSGWVNESIYNGPFYDVLFLRKGSLSHTKNAMDTSPVAQALHSALAQPERSRFANVTIADAIYLESYSIQQQIQLVSRAKVVVSQVGSTSFGAFWLPPGATLALLHTGEQLDFFFWDNLPWLTAEFCAFSTPDTNAINRVVSVVIAGLVKFENF